MHYVSLVIRCCVGAAIYMSLLKVRQRETHSVETGVYVQTLSRLLQCPQLGRKPSHFIFLPDNFKPLV